MQNIRVEAVAQVRVLRAGELATKQPLIKAELGPGVKLSDVVEQLEKMDKEKEDD